MLIVSPKFSCTQEVLTIVAMLSGRWCPPFLHIIASRTYPIFPVPNVWVRPNNHQNEADVAKQLLTVPSGDHLTLLNVFNEYQISMSCFSLKWSMEPY